MDGSFADGAGEAAKNGALFGAAGSVAGDALSGVLGAVNVPGLGEKGTLSPGGAVAGVIKGNSVGNLSPDDFKSPCDPLPVNQC